MRRWPDTLPTPSEPGFGLTPVDQVIRTDMEVGFARVRRITFARHDNVDVQWEFSDAEMAAFRAWWGDEAWSLAGDSDSLTGWGVNAASLIADTTVGPDLVLADRLVDTVALDVHYAQKVLTPAPLDGTMVIGCASLHVAGRKWARLGLVDRAGALCWTNVNVETGEFGGMGGLVSRTIKDRGDGWWRVSITAWSGTGATNPVLRLDLLDATPTAYYAGDGLSGVDVCEVNARVVTGYDLFVRSDASGNALGASGGSAWVTVPIAVGGGFQYVEARFKGPFKASAGAGLNWDVSAALEVRNA